MITIHENTRTAVQRHIDSGETSFRIGNHWYEIGYPVTLLYGVECRMLHQWTITGCYWHNILFLYKGHVYIDESDVYAAAKEA